MTDIWYPVTDDHPLSIVQVRAIVRLPDAHDPHLIVSRGRAPHIHSWVEWIKGKPVPLPSGAVVALWQPQHPNRWQAELPAPAMVAEYQMWSPQMAFGEVDDAEAGKCDHMDNEPSGSDTGLPWWRVGSNIKYQAPGSVTPRMAEGRVMRAVHFCGHGKDFTLPMQTFSALMARMAEKREQYTELAFSDVIPRIQAMPRDHDDFLTAMSWFAALRPRWDGVGATWSLNRAQRCLLYRSLNVPLSWEVIANLIGVGGSRSGRVREAHRIYDAAIVKITRFANGIEMMPAEMDLADPRERNRLAKLSAA